ncbi:MAG: L,D-transpeptidase family protein [Verrucomicrobiaceae bacterium]
MSRFLKCALVLTCTLAGGWYLLTHMTATAEEVLQKKKLKKGDPIFIRAFKEEKELEVWLKREGDDTYTHFRTYPIAAASGQLGPKLAEGDRQVPEGFYFVPPASMKPDSDFHRAFNIGYPNAYDRAHNRTGTFIMVHGSVYSIGCLAMTDEKIEEIYDLCHAAHQNGQEYFRIHIFPFRMTEERMAKAQNNPWYPFWQNLATGYHWFEKKKAPPNVTVKNKTYRFN